MITYKDILNNEFVINEYGKMDEINPVPFNHGLKHIRNVCNIMDKLTDLLNITGEEKEGLLIACALHDIGKVYGKENHGLKSREITEREFNDELKEYKFYNEILSAIENHDHRFSDEYPLFTTLVQFSDKMDFTKNRLDDNWKEKFDKDYYWAEINDVEFIYNEEYFGINILANKVENEMQRFYDENFSQKVIAAVKTLAKKLELKPVIKINGNEILLNNYLIIHGSFGSPEGNWFPYLRRELVNRKQNVKVPQMPVGVGVQNFESWAKVLNKKCLIDEDTIIFAHSIAPVAVSKFLIENKIKVKRLVFVCGFNNYLGINEEYDSVNESMYLDNLEDIRNYCNDIICYYSDNDPYVTFDTEKDFADTVSNEQHIIENGGHLNSESGYTEFKELLKHI